MHNDWEIFDCVELGSLRHYYGKQCLERKYVLSTERMGIPPQKWEKEQTHLDLGQNYTANLGEEDKMNSGILWPPEYKKITWIHYKLVPWFRLEG